MTGDMTKRAPRREVRLHKHRTGKPVENSGDLRRLRRGRALAVGMVSVALLAVLFWTVVGVVGAMPRIVRAVDLGAERRLALVELGAALGGSADGTAAAAVEQRTRLVDSFARFEAAERAALPEPGGAARTEPGLGQLQRFRMDAARLAAGLGGLAADNTLARSLRIQVPGLLAAMQAAGAADVAAEMAGLYGRLLILLLVVVVGLGVVGLEHVLGFRPMAARLEAGMAELARSRDDMEREARSDKLTGLPNRAVYQETLDREIKRVRRHGGGLALVVVDIDHFKKVNDTYGHDGGDRVLVEAAQLVARCVRDIDVACRIGGEEFAVVLPETGADGATVVAERVRKHVAGAPIAVGGRRTLSVTVSLGVAAWTPGMSLDDLFKAADTELYRAKQSGRNRVCVFGRGDSRGADRQRVVSLEPVGDAGKQVAAAAGAMEKRA